MGNYLTIITPTQKIHTSNKKCTQAKHRLKKWFDQSKNECDYICIGDLSFRPNRPSGVFLDYPICKDIYHRPDNMNNSWVSNWDEISGQTNEFVPTYKECVETFCSYPINTIDIICSHKGSPIFAIHIYDSNPMSQQRINTLKKFGVNHLIEINAHWILNQTSIPTKLEYKKLISEPSSRGVIQLSVQT